MIIFKSKSTFYTGILFIIIGAIFSVWATAYEIRTATNMGPGYFPLMLGILLAVFGIVNVIKSVIINNYDSVNLTGLRPLVFILLSSIVFGLLLGGIPLLNIPSFGLIAAIFVSVLMSSYAKPGTTLKEILIISTILSVVCCLLFVAMLKMPVLLIPQFIK